MKGENEGVEGQGGASLDDNSEGTGDNVDKFFLSLFYSVKEDQEAIGAKYVSYSSFIWT